MKDSLTEHFSVFIFRINMVDPNLVVTNWCLENCIQSGLSDALLASLESEFYPKWVLIYKVGERY